ncbi:hypothetical protein [Acaryochloris marina]|uniref:Uncharacterized protein n=1 Tax=Acaryochloris marina (strain MBIC 11017) TaxID=329726 RepID=A8ZQY3_ACAM1|nr:hypothetical protein [Acaryochloris marina]ABW33419.1 hypothetical protein AM1_H0069 [Acaryochloris marina MBIC11017]
MAKRKITDLLSNELTNSVSSKESNSQSSEVKDNYVSSHQVELAKGTQELPESVSNEVPKYLTMERKEIRLPQEHLDQLTMLARQLNRARKNSGERITENTLIRVAIAAMLEHTDQLRGISEDELLQAWMKYVSSQ